MRLRSWIILLSLALISATAAIASEEEVAPVKSLAIVADAGKPWGDVTVKVTLEKKGKSTTVAAITVATEAGGAIDVPREAVTGIDSPNLQSLTVTHEGGTGDGPWLYVRINYGPPLHAPNISIRDPDPDEHLAGAVIAIHDHKVVYRATAESFSETLSPPRAWKKVWEAK